MSYEIASNKFLHRWRLNAMMGGNLQNFISEKLRL
jgi:hypothetical protein